VREKEGLWSDVKVCWNGPASEAEQACVREREKHREGARARMGVSVSMSVSMRVSVSMSMSVCMWSVRKVG